MKVLLVDNDRNISELLRTELNKYQYEGDIAGDNEEAKKLLSKQKYGVVLIDWADGKSCMDLILHIKRTTKKTAVIVLSAVDGKDPEITALNGGGDDYVKKPIGFNRQVDPRPFEVLEARIEARLRFGGTNIIEIGDLVIDPDEEKIFYKGKEIELKGKPFEVLTHLARHRDQIVSKEQLLDAIWEEPELVTPNVIEVAINQIRQKMDKPLGIGTIETVRRRGYRFCFPNCDGSF